MNGKNLTIVLVVVVILALTGAAYAENLLMPMAQPGNSGSTATPNSPGMMGGGSMGSGMMDGRGMGGGMMEDRGMGGGMTDGRGMGGGQLMMRLMRGLVRGELVIQSPNGKLHNVRIDRGTVAEASATEITITEKGDRKLTLTIESDTKVLGKKIEEIKKGDRLEAIRIKKAGYYKTAVIISRPKPADQPLGDLFGDGKDIKNSAHDNHAGSTDNTIF